ncbi:MAG: tRNA uridine-5-carboxymethylaminomethyl(34) synthesis GTPase MnmE [Selenomonadaceae bacterium]|nr:tRNA uridine-5-carboxymethylaminomethyl(34) synthesis GTPase MnmE [Selenomonadaceae bacterium]
MTTADNFGGEGDTISAIATAVGEAGIGIVRLSGALAVAIADKIFVAASGLRLAETPSHRALYGHIKDLTGSIIDECLVISMRAPHSYTREDVVEIQSHGGRVVMGRILALTYELGARPAQRGEFTKRAFLNGRLDLSAAEAVMDLISAKTEAARQVAVKQLTGGLRRKIEPLRDELLAMLAHLEATIDFPEDDIEAATLEAVAEKINKSLAVIQELITGASTGRILREGLKTAIIGKPNVGKSSLLNALLAEERAIVTDIPGTTRDTIEEYAEVEGVPLLLIDTAGIREAEDGAEKLGIERARRWATAADLVLAVFDHSKPLTAEDEAIFALLKGKTAFILLNKSDLAPAFDLSPLQSRFSSYKFCSISAKREQGLTELKAAIAGLTYTAGETDREVLVTKEEQLNLLREAASHLRGALTTIEGGLSADFVTIDLKSAWEKLGEITGDTATEDIIDEIFARFCIGK